LRLLTEIVFGIFHVGITIALYASAMVIALWTVAPSNVTTFRFLTGVGLCLLIAAVLTFMSHIDHRMFGRNKTTINGVEVDTDISPNSCRITNISKSVHQHISESYDEHDD